MSGAESIRNELRGAIPQLRDRGLHQGCKWAAEQLMGLPPPGIGEGRTGGHGSTGGSGEHEGDDDGDAFAIAKAYFDLKEYRRAAHALKGARGARATFLRCYSLYLAGEKRKNEEMVEISGPLGHCDVANQELPALEAELRLLRDGSAVVDPFCLFLHGLVLREVEKKAEAVDALVLSLQAFPCNWEAWQALLGLCSDKGAAEGLALPNHWCKRFFEAALSLESQHNQEGLDAYQALAESFPSSCHVVAQVATARYNLRDFDEAEALFDGLFKRDPYRIDGMDTYSNILYVKECFAALSFLAHQAVLTDKYRPETCCIVGNYYSLKAQHEKAVTYFQRALKLNRGYLSAWTLMGHEYVEMKNPPAAIDAYRRAVDISPRDYRAWYGLGQVYEFLAMPYYALYYFRRATQLRPQDARMWCAMGQCYESDQLGMTDAAVRCYTRAVRNNDREGIALHKLAKLHEQLGQRDKAAHYYRSNLKRIDGEQAMGMDAVDALLFLATYCKDTGALAEAEGYCNRLLDFGGPEKEKAKALMREMRSLQMGQSPHTPGAGAGGGGGGVAGGGVGTPLSARRPGFGAAVTPSTGGNMSMSSGSQGMDESPGGGFESP